MYAFGGTSTKRLNTCHEDIRRVMWLAISKTKHDFGIVEGRRNKQRQNKAYATGASKVPWPGSYHNAEEPDLSLAVDAAPYANGDYVWSCETDEDVQAWYEVVTAIKEAARELGVKLDWGYDLWNWDRPHWQLTRMRK